jgi:hypothetical protein
MKTISEWLETGDMADTWCIATAGCAACFIIFPPTMHLRCMMLLSIVLNVIPQIQDGAEMIMEVTSRLLHFLVSAALSTMTTTAVCNTLSSMTCATPALFVTFAPLIGVVLASLVDIASSTLISRMVGLSLCRGPGKDRDLPVARNLVGDDFGWWTPMERVYASR